MRLLTLSGLENAIQYFGYFSRKKIQAQKRLLDKCNLLIHIIICGNIELYLLKDYHQVGIYSKRLRKILGKEYKKILTLLMDAEIIYINNSYMTVGLAKIYNAQNGTDYSASPKRYSLSKDAIKKMKVVETRFYNKSFEKRAKSFKGLFCASTIDLELSESQKGFLSARFW